MGGLSDTILICVKFGGDQISSLDFSFIVGVVPLISISRGNNQKKLHFGLQLSSLLQKLG